VARRPFRTTWEVTPPQDADTGTYTLDATITYRGGARRNVTVETEAVVAIPEAPPAGTSALSDLGWMASSNGWGPVEIDTSNGEDDPGDGNPITIQGQVFAKGLGVHAVSTIEYFLGGRCSALAVDVGVDDEEGAEGSVTFEIWADDAKVADSGPMTNADPAKRLQADLGDATFLRLVVTDGGDGKNSDHGDWADPRLTCA
jgi:alpha-galactosidase